jgi:hypothetical protein
VQPIGLAGAAEILYGVAGAKASIHGEIKEIREVFYPLSAFSCRLPIFGAQADS